MALRWEFFNYVILSFLYSSFDSGCCYGGGGGGCCEIVVFDCDGSCCVVAVFDGGVCFGGITLDDGCWYFGSDSSK